MSCIKVWYPQKTSSRDFKASLNDRMIRFCSYTDQTESRSKWPLTPLVWLHTIMFIYMYTHYPTKKSLECSIFHLGYWQEKICKINSKFRNSALCRAAVNFSINKPYDDQLNHHHDNWANSSHWRSPWDMVESSRKKAAKVDLELRFFFSQRSKKLNIFKVKNNVKQSIWSLNMCMCMTIHFIFFHMKSI